MNYFNRIVEIDSNFSPVYNARGMVYDKMEQYAASYGEFTKAIDFDPKNSVFYHNRGCCLKNM